MNNTKRMLKEILNGQEEMRIELLAALDKLDKNISKLTMNLGENIDVGFDKLNKRIDEVDLQFANLIKRRKIAAQKRLQKLAN